MSHLPPQNPNNDPHIQDAGHPRNTLTPVPYGRYDPPVGQTPAAGSGSTDPVLVETQRKRSATHKVSVAGGIIGLITMIIQMIFITIFLALFITHGEHDPPFGFFVLFVVLVTPYIVGIAWVATFILAPIACIRAHLRMSQNQPDGWVGAKMPISALLAVSIMVGSPASIVCIAWPLMLSSGSALEPLFVVCALAEVLIAMGFTVLLRKSKALGLTVRAFQAQEARILSAEVWTEGLAAHGVGSLCRELYPSGVVNPG